MSLRSDQAGELLRARGLRSTPQRRAILGAFQGGPTEHLSADEVHARAAESLPDLSRGTVYATLAEFSELGLLSASGAPEPVRYETNTTHHSHFRCRLCLRIFDLVSGLQNPEEITDAGFSVERVDTRAEGICAECNDYNAGLKAGARAISRSGPDRRHARCARRRHHGPRRPTRSAATGRHPPGPDPHRVRRSRRFRRATGSRHQPPRQPGRPPPPHRRHRQTPRLLRRQHPPGAMGHRLGVPGVLRRARAEINRINPLRRPPVLQRPHPRRLSSRPRPDHGRQPHPHRRALPPRHPRRRNPNNIRRRSWPPPLARKSRNHRQERAATLARIPTHAALAHHPRHSPPASARENASLSPGASRWKRRLPRPSGS